MAPRSFHRRVAKAVRRRRRARFGRQRAVRRNFQRVPRVIRTIHGPRRAIMPRTQLVRFKICQALQIIPDATEKTKYTVVALDLVDPMVGVGANQPIGFDQWMAFYENFQVVSGTVRIRCKNETAKELVIGLMKDRSGTSPATTLIYQSWCQFPLMKTVFLGPEGVAGNEVARVKFISSKGTPSIVLRGVNAADLLGTGAASPTERVFFHLFISDPTGADLSNVLHVSAQVEMTIIVKLMNRTQLVITT